MRIDEQPRPRVDEQPRTRWVDQAHSAAAAPTCGSAARSHRLDRAGGTAGDRITVQHTVRTSTAEYSAAAQRPRLARPPDVGEALRDAVAELRAIDLTYGPNRPDSLVSQLRRGEISPESYPPLADLVDRCAAMRAATDGWFDAWAVPGGFDPGGLLGGWAVERAAARLRAAGIHDYAVLSGADLVVRGHAAHGGPWRVAVHHPTDADRAPLVLEMTAGAVGTSGVTGRRGTWSTRTPASRPTSWSPPPSSARTSPSPTPTPPRSTPPARPGWPGSATARTTGRSSPTAAADGRSGALRRPAGRSHHGRTARCRRAAIGPHGLGNDRGGRSATSARGSRNRGVRTGRAGRPTAPPEDGPTPRLGQ